MKTKIQKIRVLAAVILLALSTGLYGCWHTRTTGTPSVTLTGGSGGETVVLLHGLNRSGNALSKMADALEKEGYVVMNCTYPSRSATVEKLSDDLFRLLRPHLRGATRVHFVTHSMGGIMVREWLAKNPLPNLGRVVMLGPPNGGSEVVDALGDCSLFQWINGPAGSQLGTEACSLPLALEPPAFNPGVIAGDRTVNPLLSMLIPGRDDGKVAVCRTKVEGMSDFICLHVTHPCMVRNSQVIEQTRHFLKQGCFDKSLKEQSTGSIPQEVSSPSRQDHN